MATKKIDSGEADGFLRGRWRELNDVLRSLFFDAAHAAGLQGVLQRDLSAVQAEPESEECQCHAEATDDLGGAQKFEIIKR
jgi:hypothetical protein